ncbi:MAG: hypothetical protein Q8936_12925 [Bacillota bacterium]|nr:hypothetical protein [Bacillota bacterium]
MKKITKSIFSLMVFAILLLTGLLVPQEAKAAANIDIKVQYGIDGKYKLGKSIPLSFDITNSDKDIQGELQVEISQQNNTYILYSQSVNLPSGSKKHVVLSVPINNGSPDIVIRLNSNNKKVYEKSLRIGNGRIPEGNLMVGVLSDDYNSLSYLAKVTAELNPNSANTMVLKGINNGTNNKVTINSTVVKVDQNTISSNEKSIECLDVLVINNFDTSKLSKEQYAVLKAWVENGGMLIIGTGPGYQKTLSLFKNNNFINGEIGSISKISTQQFNDKLGLTGQAPLSLDVLSMKINDGKVIMAEGNEALITAIDKSNGRIVLCNFDLGLEPMVSWANNTALWKSLYSQLLPKSYQMYAADVYNNGQYYMAQESVQNTWGLKTPTAKGMGIALTIYVLIIGPLGYLLLKKLNKRNLLWGIVPALSIVFAVIIYCIGSPTRITSEFINRVDFVDLNSDGSSKIQSYLGFVTPRKGDLKIEETTSEKLSPLFGDNNGGYNNPSYAKLGLEVYYEGDKTYYQYKNAAPFQSNLMTTSMEKENYGKLDSKLQYFSGNLSGTISNNLDSDLENVYVVTSSGVWDAGAIKKGQNAAINGNSKFYRSIGEVVNYFNVNMNNNNGADAAVKRQTVSLLNMFSQNMMMNASLNGSNTSNYIVAIKRDKIVSKFKINGKAADEYRTSVINTPVNIDFIKDGKAEYPYGYFTPTVLKQDGQGGYDEQNSYIMGSINLDLSYSFPAELQVDQITIKELSPTNNYNGATKFNGEYYILNVKDNKYDKIDFKNNEAVISDLSSYLSNNEIKVNVRNNSNNNGGPSILPGLSVKGRVK